MERLQQSHREIDGWNPPLFDWKTVSHVNMGEALGHVTAGNFDARKIPEGAREKDILTYLKTGDASTMCKPQYMLFCARTKHLETRFVLVLSKPSHMRLYERLLEFVALPVHGSFDDPMPGFLENLFNGPDYYQRVYPPILMTKAEFDASGGWGTYRGQGMAEEVDDIVNAAVPWLEEYLIGNNPSQVRPLDHDMLANIRYKSWPAWQPRL